ncbi:MAG: thioredoxin domain-containing protein [Pseudomonadota bacterium]
MPNHLSQETSPYLQQHADNPVDWYPWGKEALSLAQQQNKPILLSIGYSACHWCHVMAHESFEDEGIAAIMNRHFINIKVDHEERPDLDQIYQLAHQMLTQRGGGWPLTMFLTSDGKPFFGGTYFPKTPRYNLPGFGQLIEQVAQYYIEHSDAIDEQNTRLLAAFQHTSPTKTETDETLQEKVLDQAAAGLQSNADKQYGGFGGAPKFPHPTDLEFLLRRYAKTKEMDVLHIPAFTLEKMVRGGIYDQLGGGFSRYSVDQQWMIPHFEKMLYDNGPLLRLVADTWLITGNKLFERAAHETAAWVLREMQSPEGGYYSTIDADSEGEEGKFYVWMPAEVEALLTTAEYQIAALAYGFDGPPNFEHSHWHLHVVRTIEAVAQAAEKPIAEVEALLASTRTKLFTHREKRVHPGRDEKILTSWNGLMIHGMARAGFAFNQPEWIASARRALDFIRNTLWKNGRLLATYKDHKAHLNAYLDDYAFLLAATLELLQADYRSEDLHFATQLADVLLNQFEDKNDGGFFFTSHDHENLIHRSKSGHDNATPSGNGIAALALIRLSYITGNMDYSAAAERTLRLFYPDMSRQLSGYSSLLMAVEERLNPTQVVIIRGQNAELPLWRDAMRKQYRPTVLTLFLPNDIADLPASLAKPVKDHVNAWVCRGVTCLSPVETIAKLEMALQ